MEDQETIGEKIEEPTVCKDDRKEESPKRKRNEDEQQDKQQPDTKRSHIGERLLEDLGLPNEIWTNILAYVYFDSSILDGANDIYEGITITRDHILKYFKTIPLVCKTFNGLTISKNQWAKSKEEIRSFYIPHPNKRFLETRKNKEGLFPKNGEWHTDSIINNQIAQFIATGSTLNDTLSNILILAVHDNNLKLIHLLLWYGANPNVHDEHRKTALSWANHPTNQHKIAVISLLLRHHSDPNLRDSKGKTALFWATLSHHPKSQNNIEAITLLLQHGADPNLRDHDFKTALFLAVFLHHPTNRNNIEAITLLLRYGAKPTSREFDIARKQNFLEFEQLVRIHSKQSGSNSNQPIFV